MKCIIIEDQAPAQRILKKYIEDIGTLELKATYSNALEAMELLKSEHIDIIFLDIHLPKLSGIDFLKMMPNHPNVILTTAFPDYAIQSYEFNVIDYLLKPFSFQRFVQAINKVSTKKNPPATTKSSENARKELYIKSGYELIKVIIDDIILIKSDADYTEIHISNKVLLSAESLRYWDEKLDNNQFVRIHKSYIINTFKIDKISGNMVCLVDNVKVPIGRYYKEGFIKKFVN